MTLFRPCIDLHAGHVKQIVGGTLTDDSSGNGLKTNHISEHSASYFAHLYKKHNVRGGHVIMLGPGNEDAAIEAVKAWPGGLQIGGGINEDNAKAWIERGAEKAILNVLGDDKKKLVVDLSCRRQGSNWVVAMNKWQKLTGMEVNSDNEGLQRGVDEELVQKLSSWCTIPVTYAGGGRSLEDLDLVHQLSNGRVDLTIGSALDIFGGSGIKFEEAVAWNRKQETEK